VAVHHEDTKNGAEIHHRGAAERVVDHGTLGLFFADQPVPSQVSDLVLQANVDVSGGVAAQPVHTELRVAEDTYALAMRIEITAGVKSVEVAARRLDGGTEILLFAKDLPLDWPTPYIFKAPVLLRKGTRLSVIASYANDAATPRPGGIRLTVSRYPKAAG
jgi:hypothetical protein